MRKFLIQKLLPITLALVGCALAPLLMTSTRAQEAQKQPESAGADNQATENPASVAFVNATLADVLKWAQHASGKGFIATAAATQQADQVRVNWQPPRDQQQFATLAVLDLALRSSGLVMVASEELAGVYDVMTLKDAAGRSPVVTACRELGQARYGTLALEARVLGAAELGKLLEPYLSSWASMTVITLTSRIMVMDYAANLRAVEKAALEAERHAERNTDNIYKIFVPLSQSPRLLASLVQASRSGDEKFEASSMEPYKAVMVVGERESVKRAMIRLADIDTRELLPSEAPILRTYDALVQPVEQLHATLSKHFAIEIERGQLAISPFAPREQLVINSGEHDWQRIKAVLAEIDRSARNESEQAKEDAGQAARQIKDSQQPEGGK